MGKKLFVGRLPLDLTEDQLHNLFTPVGQVVSTTLVMDKYTGQSRGFGFVEMSSDAEAQTAIQKLNGTTVGTRQIVVNEARPMESRAPRGGFGGGGRGGYRPGKGRGFNR